MKFEPWPYQRKARRWLLKHPQAMEFVGMGLGKTVVMLDVITDLLAGLETKGALVIGPINVVENTWPDEIKQWDHLNWVKYSLIRGSPAERMAALATPAHVYLINYELIPWLSEVLRRAVKKDKLPFDMIVFDESSKMKNPGAVRYRRIKPMLRVMKRHVVMTGTPNPNSYVDLFSQTFLVDQGKRFGPFFGKFRQRYFDHNPYTYETTIKPGAKRAIEAKIRDITLSMSAADYLDLPPVIYNNIRIPLSKKLMAQYKELEDEMFLALERAEIEVFSAAALSNKCRQFTSGVLYDEDKVGHTVHDAKLDRLAELVEDAGSENLLVVYEFRSEIKRFLKRWPKAPWIGGGSKDPRGCIKRWNTGEVPLMFVHPASVGHGLNLQHGGHQLIWTSGTWSLELYQQTNARLDRMGQKKSVIVTHLTCPGTTDDAVMQVLRTKAKGLAGLLKAMKANRSSR